MSGSIGHRTKLLRLQSDLSMIELAEQLDVDISQATISNIESGKHIPRADVIIAYAKFFNVTTDYILTGSNYLPPEQIQKNLELYKDEINEIAARASKLYDKLNRVEDSSQKPRIVIRMDENNKSTKDDQQ